MAEPLSKQARPKKPQKKSTTPWVTPSILEEGLRLGTALKAVLPRNLGPSGIDCYKRYGLENKKEYYFEGFEIDKGGYYRIYIINEKGNQVKEPFHCSFFRIIKPEDK